jgi:SAM-dependent methyltransferase
MQCRFCKSEVTSIFIDLINSPAANSFLSKEQLDQPEYYYPLKVNICNNCFLVQIREYKTFDSIFDNEYVYFSSYSKAFVEQARKYTEEMVTRFGYAENSQVIEIASNDGYLLQFFKEKNVPVLGIEPTANTAAVAKSKGIESITEFFGADLAKILVVQNRKADLLLANNVIAHVPDLNDFVSGMKILLKEDGVITVEFPHVMKMIDNHLFDMIYHEHFSYLSLYTIKKVFEAHGLDLFDVEEVASHGGSYRIYGKHKEDKTKSVSPNLTRWLELELKKGINKISYYENFQEKAKQIKFNFTKFLLDNKLNNKSIAAYGAAAKGNTLLNYCGIKNDIIDFIVDANPNKQNKWLPGSHIPVVNEEYLKNAKPDFLVIFAWNLKDEIIKQLSYVREWNGKFVIPIPVLEEL